jgi:hypothetical protein
MERKKNVECCLQILLIIYELEYTRDLTEENLGEIDSESNAEL